MTNAEKLNTANTMVTDTTAPASPFMSPLLFISHGAPTFALHPGALGARLKLIGQEATFRETTKALVVVSPHWQSRGFQVMSGAHPATLHDFGGFPDALYQLQYPAPGSPSLAGHIAALMTAAGLPAKLDEERPFDHGAWVPLLHLAPEADIPVVQVSMPINLDAASAMQLGAVLAPLRQQGIVLIGSGSMTHNLRDIAWHATAPEPYAQEFVAWVRSAVLANQVTDLANYRERAPHAVRAHPTDEHFLPLLMAIGANRLAQAPQILDTSIDLGVLSMESYGWDLPAPA